MENGEHGVQRYTSRGWLAVAIIVAALAWLQGERWWNEYRPLDVRWRELQSTPALGLQRQQRVEAERYHRLQRQWNLLEPVRARQIAQLDWLVRLASMPAAGWRVQRFLWRADGVEIDLIEQRNQPLSPWRQWHDWQVRAERRDVLDPSRLTLVLAELPR
ncbi:hypothetical protein OAS86_04195 [Gammaproteobacteria bacterium]|nr:hypothetical protein [Gammaproteobacteria bacterium]